METLGALQSCCWALKDEIPKSRIKLQMPVSFENDDDMVIDLVDVCKSGIPNFGQRIISNPTISLTAVMVVGSTVVGSNILSESREDIFPI